jgi:hypothetical protein
VEQFPHADQTVFLLDGRLGQEEPYVGDVYQDIRSGAVDAEESREFSGLAIEDKATLISKANKIDDLRRAAGDSAVYAYYLRYVGWTNAVIFVFFVTMNVFSSTYSRTWTFTCATPDLTNISFLLEIWLKRWADRGGGQKGLYVSVYFFLAICNTVGNGGYVW